MHFASNRKCACCSARSLQYPLCSARITTDREALGNRLRVAERRLARAGGNKVDRLVHAAERRHVDGLPPDDAGGAHARAVLARAAVDDGVHQHLQRVLVRQQVDDLKRVLDDPHRLHLLARVPAVEHERAHQPLDDRARRLAEPLLLVAARRVRQVHRVALGRLAGGDVVLQRDVVDLDVRVRPLAEELDFVGEAVAEKGKAEASASGC